MNWNILRRFVLVLTAMSVMGSPAFAHPPKVYGHSNGKLIVNGKEYSRTFWTAGFDLGDALADNQEAYELYLDHVKYRRWFAALNWGAVAAAFTYAGTTPIENFDSGTYFTIFLVPFIGGMFANQASQSALVRAVNVYNGVPPEEARYEMDRPRWSAENEVAVLGWQWGF